MNGSTPSTYLLSMLRRQPQAYTRIRGSDAYPGIAGTVFFYQTVRGAVVAAEVSGLPPPRAAAPAASSRSTSTRVLCAA